MDDIRKPKKIYSVDDISSAIFEACGPITTEDMHEVALQAMYAIDVLEMEKAIDERPEPDKEEEKRLDEDWDKFNNKLQSFKKYRKMKSQLKEVLPILKNVVKPTPNPLYMDGVNNLINKIEQTNG